MIKLANQSKTDKATSSIGIYTKEEVEQKFHDMIPAITKEVRRAFREYDPDKREDALECVLVQSYLNLRSLAEKGRLDEAYPSPIAKFAIASYKDGRPAGFESSSTDVLGERTKLKGRSELRAIHLLKTKDDPNEYLADPKANVGRIVAFKIDFFETFLPQQTQRDQEIIHDMMQGETTGDLAKKYGVSAASISQYRRRYADSWYTFQHGEEEIDLVEELRALADETDSPAN